MILRREDGARQEVELVGPETAGAAGNAAAARAAADAASSSAGLPQPLCPHGAPLASLPDEAEESVSAPGVSPLDEALEKLLPDRQATEMGSHDEHSGRKGGDA